MELGGILSVAPVCPKVQLEIMVAFLINDQDFRFVKKLKYKVTKKYLIANMTEFPFAALNAGIIIHYLESFSFGANNLTQKRLRSSRN